MHLEIQCPGCDRRAYFTKTEAGCSHTCPSCSTEYVVPQPGEPLGQFELSDHARAIAADRNRCNGSPHIFLRVCAALFVFLAALKGVLALAAIYQYSVASEKTSIHEQIAASQASVFSALDAKRRQANTAFLILAIISGIESALFAYAARSLRAARRYSMCFFSAIIACLTVPVGMALGVVTVVVLLDRDVSSGFGIQRPRPAS